jgi:hypothetical protein
MSDKADYVNLERHFAGRRIQHQFFGRAVDSRQISGRANHIGRTGARVAQD